MYSSSVLLLQKYNPGVIYNYICYFIPMRSRRIRISIKKLSLSRAAYFTLRVFNTAPTTIRILIYDATTRKRDRALLETI